jgi:hypothetical protein
MLVTSSRFPNFLVSQGLEVEKATEVAAVYARSLDFIHTVLSGKKTWHGGENRAVKRIQQLPGRPEIWHPQFDQTFLKVEFSAAGTVALEATGVTLAVEGPHPLSPHIAGLLDPVKPSFTPGVKTDSTFLGLQEIITHTTR